MSGSPSWANEHKFLNIVLEVEGIYELREVEQHNCWEFSEFYIFFVADAALEEEEEILKWRLKLWVTQAQTSAVINQLSSRQRWLLQAIKKVTTESF